MSTWNLIVTMHSDWHVGSGSGGGSVDRRTVRDHEGLPYIPAKSLTGVLRDTCEEVCAALFPDEPDVADAWVERLFGSTRQPATVSVRPARMTTPSRTWLEGLASETKTSVLDGLCTIRAGVQIDRATGRAADDHLSFTEVARPMTLESTAEIDDDSDETLALFAAACSLTEYVGGKRRRGLGRCSIALVSADGRPPAVDVAAALPTAAPPRLQRDDLVEVAHTTESSAERVGLWLTLTSVTPLLFPRSRNGNTTVSHDHVPGAALMPVVHGLLAGAGIDASSAFRTGLVRVSAAHPMVGDELCRPVPLAFSAEKDPTAPESPRIFNSTVVDIDDLPVTKQMRSGWITERDGALSVHRVAMTTQMHNSVDDTLQRPSEDTGGLYSYVAVAPGQSFRALIQMTPQILAALTSRGLPEVASVGASRKDDYGQCRLTWTPVDSAAPRNGDVTELSLWCTTPLIVDSVLDQSQVAAIERTVARSLGVQSSQCRLDVERSRFRPTRLDSWHSRWGVPRPSIIGLAAGSVLRVVVDTPVSGATLSSLETNGVGRRTTEGFGSVIVNDPLLDRSELSMSTSRTTDVTPPRGAPVVAMPDDDALSRAVVYAVMAAVHETITDLFWSDNANHPAWMPRRSGENSTTNHQFAILRRWAKNVTAPLNTADKDQFDHDFDSWPNKQKDAAWALLSDPATAWATVGDFAHPFGGGMSTLPQGIDAAIWPEIVRGLVEAGHRRLTRGAGRG